MIDITQIHALRDMPKYAKYMRDIVVCERLLLEFKIITLTEECHMSVINKIYLNLKDPRSFALLI